jgi:hypothetical protein
MQASTRHSLNSSIPSPGTIKAGEERKTLHPQQTWKHSNREIIVVVVVVVIYGTASQMRPTQGVIAG